MTFDIGKVNLSIEKLLGAGMISLGLLFFIILLHILSISTYGYIQDTITTFFHWFLMIYVGLMIFGIVIAIIQLLRWLTWSISTPEWKKKKEAGR